VTAAAFSPDSKLLATGDLVGSMRIWLLKPSKSACGIQAVESAHDMGVQTCDFCPSRGNNTGIKSEKLSKDTAIIQMLRL
jgi:WD40 repeat protein